MSNSIMNFFRNLFTHPESHNNQSANKPDLVPGFRDPIWDTYGTDESEIESRLPFGSMFSIDSNPVEMHRFFESRFDEIEQKMNEMMRDFATPDSFHNFFSLFDVPISPPAIEEPPNKNLRDELLKPGFRSGESAAERVDGDLDGRITSKDLGSILDNKRNDVVSVPPFSPSGGFSSISKSFISRTIRRPDGTIEREDIVRDSSGNEKKTMTTRKPDGEETIVTIEVPASGDSRPEGGQNPIVNDHFRNSPLHPEGVFDNIFGSHNRHRPGWWSW